MPGTRDFVQKHYHHFNAAEFKDAAAALVNLLENQRGKLMVTLAGAMSTAELGISLAEMIRRGKVHGICCTGANLEEDVYNLIAHDSYERIADWRSLSVEREEDFLKRDLARVTDTLIPEEAAMTRVADKLFAKWKEAEASGERRFPHEFLIGLLKDESLKPYQIPEENSWLLAAAEAGIPVYVPGWEDSTCGNMFAAHAFKGEIDPSVVKGGIEYMMHLAQWYRDTTSEGPVGYFQIGGGIAGDFAICVTPMWKYDLETPDIPHWSYFCQISDSTPSYGSYSGALPNEKISWAKCHRETPRFMIESDATIVAPLMFGYVLDDGQGGG